VYRDKSKSQQVIYFGIKKEREETKKEEEKAKQQQLVPTSFRMQQKFVEVSETYAGGCKTCEL